MVNRCTRFTTVAVALVALHFAATADAAQGNDRQNGETDANELNMEVTALQALYQFNLTHAQMEKLLPWARETAQPERKRGPARTTKEYRAKLQELRDSLASVSDNDTIDRLNDELQELRDMDEPTFDDGVDISDAARKRAPQAFRLLKVSQLTSFIAQVADNVPDPLDRIVDSFEAIRMLKGAAWREKRDEIADEVSRLLAGVDSARADRINDEVAGLLIRVRRLSDGQFARQRASLAQAARKIVGDIGPDQVVRNYVEVELATLLSNPRLHAALSAHLKKAENPSK